MNIKFNDIFSASPDFLFIQIQESSLGIPSFDSLPHFLSKEKKSSAFPYIQSSSFLIDLIFLSLIPGVAVMHVLSSFRVKIRRTCLFLGETSTTFFCIQMQNFPRM